jgi:topoisomerase-4 subunit A
VRDLRGRPQGRAHGINEFRHLLRRDLTEEDVEMLLQVRIKRISLFDINQNRKEIDDLLIAWPRSPRTSSQLVPYAVKYLEDLHKTYKKLYPRRTKITTLRGDRGARPRPPPS